MLRQSMARFTGSIHHLRNFNKMTSISSRTFASDNSSSKSIDNDEADRVAIVLSGCGVFDGSEITEAVATVVHLSAAGAKYAFFAPNIPTCSVVDHTKGEADESVPRRNVYVESARIARGNILPLSGLNVKDFDALVFPGGFGVAKNLSNFATKGHEMEVIPEVEQTIREFHSEGKPMAFMCIAPVLASRIFGSEVALTVGGIDDATKWPFHGAAHAIEAMGSKHIVTGLDQVCIDKDARIVSSAAYMSGDAKPHQVFENIGSLMAALRNLIASTKAKP